MPASLHTTTSRVGGAAAAGAARTSAAAAPARAILRFTPLVTMTSWLVRRQLSRLAPCEASGFASPPRDGFAFDAWVLPGGSSSDAAGSSVTRPRWTKALRAAAGVGTRDVRGPAQRQRARVHRGVDVAVPGRTQAVGVVHRGLRVGGERLHVSALRAVAGRVAHGRAGISAGAARDRDDRHGH